MNYRHKRSCSWTFSGILCGHVSVAFSEYFRLQSAPSRCDCIFFTVVTDTSSSLRLLHSPMQCKVLKHMTYSVGLGNIPLFQYFLRVLLYLVVGVNLIFVFRFLFFFKLASNCKRHICKKQFNRLGYSFIGVFKINLIKQEFV